MSRKHKDGEKLCPIYGKAIEESYCLNECLLNDCGLLLKNDAAGEKERSRQRPDDREP